MKKVLSVLLAVAMIASLSAVAFAKGDPKLTSDMPLSAGYNDYADIIAELEDDVDIDGATVAAANNPNVNMLQAVVHDADDPPTVSEDDEAIDYPVVGLYGPFSYNSEDRGLYNEHQYTGSIKDGYSDGSREGVRGPIEYGSVALYALIQFIPDNGGAYKDNYTDDYELKTTDDGYFTLVKSSATVSGMKIKQDWEMGKEFVDSVSIVKRKVSNTFDGISELKLSGTSDDDADKWYPTAEELGLDHFGYKEGDYYYFLSIEFEDYDSPNENDVIGTFTISKSKDPATEMEYDLSLPLDWDKSYRSDNTLYDVTDSVEIEADVNYSLKFSSDEEVEFEFDDGSTFVVDASGQSKMLLRYSTDYVNKIGNKYGRTGAGLNFWSGNNAKFNRVGEMFINCEDITGHQWLYQVNSDGTLSEVPGAEWDDSDEGFYFNTRVLGTYVISDMDLSDLIAPPVTAPSQSVVTTPVISNPSTGAAA